MTSIETRPGTWREARKDLPVLGRDGHVWTLAKLVKDPSTGRPLVTMARTIPTSGEMLKPIPIEKVVLVDWDDPIKIVTEEPTTSGPVVQAPPPAQAQQAYDNAAPVPYEPPAKVAPAEHAVGDQVQVAGATFTKIAEDPIPAPTSILGNTATGWAVPPTVDWTAAELHSHSWLMHGWTEEIGTVADAHARHEQMHAAPSGGIPHFHRDAQQVNVA